MLVHHIRKLRRSRARIAALGLVIAVLAVVACTATGTLVPPGAPAATVPAVGSKPVQPAAIPAAAPPAALSAPAAPGAAAAVDAQRSAASTSSAQPNALPDTSAQILDRMVIRTAQLSVEVQSAISSRKPVVALESTVIAHGLPRPQNLATAQRMEQIVRETGAIPATIAVWA